MTTSSPLLEINPNSLEALFNKDPETLTDEEVGKIVDELRADRERFLQQPPRRNGGGRKAQADDSLSLEDLGL